MLLIPNFDLSEKIKKQLSTTENICPFLQPNCPNFRFKTVSKIFELPKSSKTLCFKGSGVSLNQTKVSGDNQLQNI